MAISNVNSVETGTTLIDIYAVKKKISCLFTLFEWNLLIHLLSAIRAKAWPSVIPVPALFATVVAAAAAKIEYWPNDENKWCVRWNGRHFHFFIRHFSDGVSLLRLMVEFSALKPILLLSLLFWNELEYVCCNCGASTWTFPRMLYIKLSASIGLLFFFLLYFHSTCSNHRHYHIFSFWNSSSLDP